MKYKRASDIFYLYEYLTLASSSKSTHKILLKITVPYSVLLLVGISIKNIKDIFRNGSSF